MLIVLYFSLKIAKQIFLIFQIMLNVYLPFQLHQLFLIKNPNKLTFISEIYTRFKAESLYRLYMFA